MLARLRTARTGLRIERVATTLLAAVAALAVAFPGVTGAATSAEIDIPGQIVLETWQPQGLPNDPNRCITVQFLEFGAVQGATGYSAVVLNQVLNVNQSFGAAPPYPHDSYTVSAGAGFQHTFFAPAGSHRIVLGSESSGSGCNSQPRFSLVSLKATVDNPPPVASFTWRESDDDPLTIEVDASGSSDDESIAAWAWDFGEGGSGSGESTSHTFGAAGTYPVELTVTDNEGATDSETLEVQVGNPPPVASFTWAASDTDPLTIELDGSGSSDDGSIATWAWDFGDGETGTGEETSHPYDQAGRYQVELTVTDDDGATDTATLDVTVGVCVADGASARKGGRLALAAEWSVSLDVDVLNAAGAGVRNVVVEVRDNCGTVTLTEPTDRQGRTSLTTTVQGPKTLTITPLAPAPVAFTPASEVEVLDAGGGQHYSAHEFRTDHTCLAEPVTVLGTGAGDTLALFANDVVDAFGGDDTISAASGEPRVVVCGGSGGDRIDIAGAAPDQVDAGSGENTISTAGGDDLVFGGTERDIVRAGGGNDVVYAGEGNDSVSGTLGCDAIYGGDGDDTLDGGPDADGGLGCPAGVIDAGDGNDVVDGGGGADEIRGGAGCDDLDGEGGADVIDGGDDADGPLGCEGGGLDGGAEADTIRGGTGLDTIVGGPGGDTILGESERDTIDGGAGQDALDGGPGPDTIRGQGDNDEIRGGSEPDQLLGGSGCDAILGEAGDDFIEAQGGNDTGSSDGCSFPSGLEGGVSGGPGDDNVDGGPGVDRLRGDEGCDRLDGGSGASVDTISGGADDDHPVACAGGGIFGNGGRDNLAGDEGNDYVDGGADLDTIDGGGGDDELHGGDGPDRIQGDGTSSSPGRDTIHGDGGQDEIQGGDEASPDCGSGDVVFGGDARDIVQGGSGGDILVGGDGPDDLFGQGGCDDLFGGADNDLLEGGDNPGTTTELLWGEAGEDRLRGGAGPDALYGGAGFDRLAGGAGYDVLDGGVTQGGPVQPDPNLVPWQAEDSLPDIVNGEQDGGRCADRPADLLSRCDRTPIPGNRLWPDFVVRAQPQP